MARHLLLGTAGHIDHGKTSLIRALTGVDTDRLPEEKRRGITVDLGFASLEIDDLRLGIVDVPGHERFIKNMLAGATGVDLALLVAAADEGVMVQTREHFEALRYLNLPTGVIALTKCDLVDEEMQSLAADDVSQLVADSFLAEAPIVPVSATEGTGLQELRDQLAAAAARIPTRAADGPFRMAVDRCFSAPGHGTIVTGSVTDGKVACGEPLQLWPQDVQVTVRGIESHGETLASVTRGQRAALNLAGIHYREVSRGSVLASPESLSPSRLLSVQFEASRYQSRPLKARTDIRFYSGTTETVGRLRLLETKTLAPGESQIGQIELQECVCSQWGEPFVLRSLTANEVLGGGRVIDPLARRVSPRNEQRVGYLRELATDDAQTRVSAAVALSGPRAWTTSQLQQRTGVADCPSIIAQLENSGELCRFDVKGNLRWLHHETVTQLESRLLRSLTDEHTKEPLSADIPLGRVSHHFDTLEPPALLSLIVQRMAASGSLRTREEFVVLADWQPQLTANQRVLLDQLVHTCQQAGLTPPSVGELATKFDTVPDEIETLLAVGASSDTLIRLPDRETRDAKAAQRARLYLHTSAKSVLLEQVTTQLAERSSWTISEFGEALKLSRKYAIPLCNYLDQLGVTSRHGDQRQLVSTHSVTS